MKRTLTTIVAAMSIATGAGAISISVDADKATYTVGEDIVLTITAIASGGETAGSLSNVGIQVVWDQSKSSVANSPAGAGFGTSSQMITAGPNAGGSGLSTITTPSGTAQNFVASPNPSCNGVSNRCSVISQTIGLLPVGDSFVTLDAQTLVGTLVLQADALGLVGLGFDTIGILGTTTSGGFTIGTNFTTARIVPEPSTALLLASGFIGLAAQRRARAR